MLLCGTALRARWFARSGRFWISSLNRWAARAFWRDSLGARKVSACEYSQSGYDDSLSQMTSMQTGARCSGTPFSLRITQLIAGCEVPEASDALRFENKAITARAILIATAPMPPPALGKRSTPDENRLTPSSEITENTRSEALGLAETQWQGVLHSMGTASLSEGCNRPLSARIGQPNLLASRPSAFTR